jgi:hypothetical protein
MTIPTTRKLTADADQINLGVESVSFNNSVSLSSATMPTGFSTVAPDTGLERSTPTILQEMSRAGERFEQMWLTRHGSHVAVFKNENDPGMTISVVENKEGSGKIASTIRIDEAVTSIAFSSDRTKFLVTLSGMAAEYGVDQNGTLKATFVHEPKPGIAITGARYINEGGHERMVLSFAPVVESKSAATAA